MSEKKIQGIDISVPKKPKLKDIDGFNRSKKNQKWKRNPIPDNWETLSAAKQDKFIEHLGITFDGLAHIRFVNAIKDYFQKKWV